MQLAELACEAAPGVARVSWAAVREALSAAGAVVGAMAAPLAVLREIARASGPVADSSPAPHVRYSVRELEAATLFSRSTVSEALALLEHAGLVTTEARRSQTLRCALTPGALGLAVVAPTAVPPGRRDLAPEPPSEPTAYGFSTASAASAPPAESEAAPHTRAVPEGIVLLGEFAGTPIYAPPGTPLVVERDAEGRWSCRVGPVLRLGPVAPDGSVA